MIYADVLSALDLILLTAVTDNRREIIKLRNEVNNDNLTNVSQSNHPQ